MGGYGSTRWTWHTKKIQVEESNKLCIFSFQKNLKPGYEGTMHWFIGDRESGSIGFTILGYENPTAVRLYYTITRLSGEKIDIDYQVTLTTTYLTWGGIRYWFRCPIMGCGRRVGCLYLPPTGNYFGCRHCYDLTYRSSQESHMYDGLYIRLAVSMRSDFPDISWRDVKSILERKDKFIPSNFNWLPNNYDAEKYSNYLTADELCEQSGLSAKYLAQLEKARLLLPDREELYRPKLASWGRKLAYLLNEGWKIQEIKAWAKGRWKMSNPRKWPPNREEWG